MSKERILGELDRARNQRSPGIKQLRRHLKGERLTRAQAMAAKCCECSCYYEDGAVDCQNEACPIHPFMPYRARGEEAAAEVAEVMDDSEGGTQHGY